MMSAKTIIKKILRPLPDEIYIRIQYRYLIGRKLNLSNPSRYNEKLQWLKLFNHNELYTKMVDKYEVKKYISEKIGEKYVIPLYGVWDEFSQIDFSKLPNQFVLKANNSSGGNIICKNKQEFDYEVAKKKIEESLKNNVYWYGREWPYKNVPPKIIAEKYMEDESGGLQDYKVLCFNGEPKLIELHRGRYTENHTQEFYDFSWERKDINQKGEHMGEIPANKPVCLDEMYVLSQILSRNIPHVRIDWYIVNEKLYFGEITFFDGSGYVDFIPDELNYTIGKWIELPEKTE